MKQDDFTESIIEKLQICYPDVEIQKYWNKEKTLIKNFPYRNVNLEIKPLNSGVFVFNLGNFKFFNTQLFESKLLEVLDRNDSKFVITSNCIYVYPEEKLGVENSFKVLQFVADKVLLLINTIEKAINEIR